MRKLAARGTRLVGLVVASAAVLLVLGTARPSEALDATQPTTANVANCLSGGGEVSQPSGSAIRACCFDSRDFGMAAGCYICDANWSNCTYEPPMRRGAAMSQSVPTTPPTAVAPPSTTTTTPPRAVLPGRSAPGTVQTR